MRAFILAAGYGTRLKPLTDHTPKILVPVAGAPMLDRLAGYLARQGVTHAALNTHHLAGQVTDRMAHLRQTHPGLDWAAFDEPEILGTGGGLANAAPFWNKEGCVLWNGDILAALDLSELWATHARAGQAAGPQALLATLVVQARPSNSNLLVDEAGWVVGMDSARRGVHRLIQTPLGQTRPLAYNGIGVLSSALGAVLGGFAPPGQPFDLMDALLAAMETGARVGAHDMGAGFFGTTGSHKHLHALEARLAEDAQLRAAWAP